MAAVGITSLGAVTLDTFLIGENLRAKRDVRTHDYVEQFPLGEKIEIEKVVFSTGGGASNAAVTFARQGLGSTFIGKIGDDLAGREVLQALKREGVRTNQVACDLEGMTGHSTILLAPNGERTILVYRGVTEKLTIKDFDSQGMQSDWLYLSSLAGNLELLDLLLKLAKTKKIKVALNPGGRDLAKAKRLRQLLKSVTVLILNKDELTKLFKGSIEQALHQAASQTPYVVMTDGPKGSWLVHQSQLYHAPIYQEVRVVDRTGAGDAFGSGLVAALAKGQSIEQALTLASANSTSVVRQIGAKAGILSAETPPKPHKIQVTGFGP